MLNPYLPNITEKILRYFNQLEDRNFDTYFKRDLDLI